MTVPTTLFLFIMLLFVVLFLVCLIQNKRIKDSDLKIKELQDLIEQYEKAKA